MGKEYVDVREIFGRAKQNKYVKMLAIAGLACVVIALVAFAAFKAGIIGVPTATTIVVKAHPYVGEFGATDNVTVKIFDKDQVQVATVVLKAPTWSATISDVKLQDYFLVTATLDGHYWMYWETGNKTVELPDGSVATIINVTSSVETVELYFVDVGEIQWVSYFGMSGLADETETSVVLTWKFNMTAQSAVDDLTISITSNSSELNVTAVVFEGAEYELEDGNATIADFLINPNATVAEYEIGLKITENLTAPAELTVILKYKNEDGEWVELAPVEAVFS